MRVSGRRENWGKARFSRNLAALLGRTFGLPNLSARRFTTRVTLESPEGEEGYVVLRKMTTTEAQDLAKIDSSDATEEDKGKESINLTANLIVEWNLCDDDDKLVDVKDKVKVIAVLQDLPPEYTGKLFKTLISETLGRSEKSVERFPDTSAGADAGDAAQERRAVVGVAD